MSQNRKTSEYKNRGFAMQMGSPCKGFIKVNNKLYIVCTKSINLIETGIEKDPDNLYPYAPNTNQKILDKGTDNPIIKMMYEYFNVIEKGNIEKYQCCTFKSGINKEKLKVILFEILKNLSSFEDSFVEFQNAYNLQLNNIKLYEQGNNFNIEAYIPNLDKKVKDLIITEIGGILNKLTNFLLEIYGHGLSKTNKNKVLNNDKRIYDSFQIFIENGLVPCNATAVTYIEKQNDNFLSYLIDIRNALEHSSDNKYVNIMNFTLGADRKYKVPKWEIFTHNSLHTADLSSDIQMYSQKMLDFTLSLIKIAILENISSYYLYENGGLYKYSQDSTKD